MLEFEARFDEYGTGLEYRLDVLPSREFDLEEEYPYTAHLEVPDLD